ncbi:MAG TPA: hypothetical protein VMG12_01920 [Polyangiaceae bacterium]|nr:hypothetical protein [Polyangiaceae bacterium]
MRFRSLSLTLLASTLACAGETPDSAPAFVDLADDGANPPAAGASGSSSNSPSTPVTGFATDDPVQPSAAGGCTKVDFLFVVDNSLSMLEEQTALVRSFPGFMDIVEQTLGAGDFHVMVIDTDAGGIGDAISTILGRGDACAPVLGAGHRQSQSGEECGLEGTQRYLDTTQADLTTAFSCVAQVGTLGNPSEAPVDAMLASLAPAINAPGGCNAGFSRDDAILVVTLIGDEDDATSAGDPNAWRQALINAKGGSENSIVFLGLIGGDGNAAQSPACLASEVDAAPRLHQFIQAFPFGTTGDICAADYAPFFAEAVSVIDTACDDFTPIIR